MICYSTSRSADLNTLSFSFLVEAVELLTVVETVELLAVVEAV